MSYVHLSLAILAELVASLSLRESNGFSRLMPSIIVLIGYSTSFYFMSLSMRTIPVAVVYAIWSAVGICLITALSAIRFKEIPDAPAILGLVLIAAGVVCLTGFSKMSVH
jgi:small multidrug resistance pump